MKILREATNKIRAWFASLSLFQSEEEWHKELEREIDTEVEAVFKTIKAMEGKIDPDGPSSEFKGLNETEYLQSLNNLNEIMRKRRNGRKVSLPMFLAILAFSILLVRYTNPAMWMKE